MHFFKWLSSAKTADFSFSVTGNFQIFLLAWYVSSSISTCVSVILHQSFRVIMSVIMNQSSTIIILHTNHGIFLFREQKLVEKRRRNKELRSPGKTSEATNFQFWLQFSLQFSFARSVLILMDNLLLRRLYDFFSKPSVSNWLVSLMSKKKEARQLYAQFFDRKIRKLASGQHLLLP